ncbi:MAG: cbb3-type cytochrome c oxidase subunit I [Gammaproteobacteria bacterium]|nr:cbb3-type cytochrome c oxidase subunit I [Gammaproteobacteria bacterium]
MSQKFEYTLDIPKGEPVEHAKGWLYLALTSLVLGGLLTILIVLSRTPGVQNFIPWIDFFHTAIIVHVDLTVLVWFLSIAGIFWSLNSGERHWLLGKVALWLATAGTMIFTISPFVGAGDPLMNNYIPILQHPVFLVGLSVYGLGMLLMIARGLLSRRRASPEGAVLSFGVTTSVYAALFAYVALVLTYVLMPADMEGRSFYELLFWGGGHILQFTHTQLMAVAWLWLATIAGLRLGLPHKLTFWLLAIGFAPILFSPLIYVLFEVGSVEHIRLFTVLMEWGGGVAALPIGLAVVYALFKQRSEKLLASPEKSALVFSILLFATGGIIGFLISGVNVTIPAHYHGSIVAVTLAFMGAVYYLLPKMGFESVSHRWGCRQPLIYGGGQMLHVLGLAWSGGYGVQRKTAGVEQGLDRLPEVLGMGLMGLGGLIAVVGGTVFLVIVLRAIWRGKKRPSAASAEHASA